MTKKLPYVKGSTKLGLLKWRAAKEKIEQRQKINNLLLLAWYVFHRSHTAPQ